MWEPLVRLPMKPEDVDTLRSIVKEGTIESWANERYHVIARRLDSGFTWLSIKTHEREANIPWRHKQQIKNELCGPEREGVEIFPAESRLADNANEFHLWVLPEGETVGIGFPEGMVTTDEQVERYNNAPHNGRQEPWEPGLTTGRNEQTPYMSDELEAQLPPHMLAPDEDDAAKRVEDLF